MNTMWVQIITAIITIICALITFKLLPWIKAQVGDEKLNIILSYIEKAVYAAEIIFAGEEKSGEQKKAYVIAYMTQILNKLKIEIDAETLDVFIEAAVQGLKLKEKAVK